MEFSAGDKPYHFLSAASTNANSVVARPCKLGEIVAINTTATIYFLKVYDLNTAPTVGTSTVAFTIPIPGLTTGAGVVVPFPNRVEFLQGLAFALTGGVADNDTTNAATGVVIDFFVRP